MLDRMELKTRELRFLLACARVLPSQEGEATIQRMLHEGIDWTLLARKAIDHGLAGLAGHTLARVAPDMVPDDILDAFRVIVEQTRRKNLALFEELAEVTEALANNGVEAIPFKGHVVAIQAYGDLGLRMIGDLDFLIRDFDMVAAMATLRGLGYERKEALTDTQIDLVQRLQGKDFVYRRAAEMRVQLHTRLAPMTMALDIDYTGLWRRAQRRALNGRTMLTPAAEDHFLILAIHGGQGLWWNIRGACDVAALIGSHPQLDWLAILERARAQGCLRMVLLATSLAHKYFNATVPDAIAAAELADSAIEPMVGRIVADWQADEPVGPPSKEMLSMDRLRLHDGAVRRARHAMRTWFLPQPHHVAGISLPRRLSFAYVPIKIAHDTIALPLQRTYHHVLAQAGRFQDVLENSDLALAIMPASAETKLSIKRHQKARTAANRALTANPNSAAAWLHLGHALSGLKRYKQAIACYDKVLAIVPDNKVIWADRAAAIAAIKKRVALPYTDMLLGRYPQDADAWAIRAGSLAASQHYGEAVEASDRALAIDPQHLSAVRIGIRARTYACDWHRREDDRRQIAEGLRAGLNIIRPFNYRTISDSEADDLIAARLLSGGFALSAGAMWSGENYRHDRIRVAYLSPDFRDRAMAILMAGVFEHHDDTRFETTAISMGPDDGSKMRRRVEAAFDRFIDVQAMSDAEVATMLRESQIDLAIDLNSHGGGGRPGILAYRPAPVQVSYHNTGTTGAPYLDYIVADRTVIPDTHFCYYTEKVVHLPHSFFCSDSQRYVPEHTPSRIEEGLPETGFVYCCFNNSNRIAPSIFDVWMRLLNACPGSVLWLRDYNPYAMRNLRREAEARGVAPERLVFAPRSAADAHLARHRLADLYLDTLPYNAFTTASDALWAGLPVLTCLGNTFAGRVGASLLNTIGLPELVTSSLAEYEELAIALARDSGRLAAIKANLLRNRASEPLFDTARFTRDLETAYTTMWERSQRGEPPQSFSVVSDSLSTSRIDRA
jgi:protein O-GlcNAc transferase